MLLAFDIEINCPGVLEHHEGFLQACAVWRAAQLHDRRHAEQGRFMVLMHHRALLATRKPSRI